MDDEVGSVAAGVAFFVLLATFPGLAAVVSLVGLFADPSRVDALLGTASQVLPASSTEVIARHVNRFVSAAKSTENPRALSFTPFFGFAMLLWSTNKGTKALFRALNAIYGQEERRGFLVFTLLTLSVTLGSLVFVVFAIGAVVVLPMIVDVLGFPETEARLLDVLRWPVLLFVVAGVLAVIFRYGPSGGRKNANWRSIVAGSLCAAVLWLAGSFLFSLYVTTLGSFTELYGSLSAVIGFLVWIWLSIIAVLVGAELDAAIASCLTEGGSRALRRDAPRACGAGSGS